MARKPRVFFEGGIYHVTFRGNDRQTIFTDVPDRKRIIERTADFADKYQVRIYLYCLMSNHVHLLVETPRGNLSQFMAALLSGYTTYFNLRHERSGHLFQGRFGAKVVSGDDYLMRLSRYIHLNPVRTDYWTEKPAAEKIDFLNKYVWSSYRGYAGLAEPEPWVDQRPLIKMIPPRPGATPQQAYQTFIETGLAESDDELTTMMRARHGAIGSDKFIKSVIERTASPQDERASALRRAKICVPPNEVVAAVKKITGARDADFEPRYEGAKLRALLAYALQKYAGMNQREIAAHLGIQTAAAISRLANRYAHNPQLQLWRADLAVDMEKPA